MFLIIENYKLVSLVTLNKYILPNCCFRVTFYILERAESIKCLVRPSFSRCEKCHLGPTLAVLGTADFEVLTIDPASIRLAGVAPICRILQRYESIINIRIETSF